MLLNEIELHKLIGDLTEFKGKEKLEHLVHLKDTLLVSVHFRKFACFVLNKELSFHVKRFEKVQTDTSLFGDSKDYCLEDMYDALMQIHEKGSCNAQDKLRLDTIYSGLMPYTQILAQMILDRNMRCGVSLKSLRKVFGSSFLSDFPCMLCSSYNAEKIEKNIQFPAYSQLKSDGARAMLVNRQEIKSRNGKVYHGLESLIESVHCVEFSSNDIKNLVIDGELVVLDEFGEILPRSVGNGILNKSIQGTITQEEADRVQFIVWDIIKSDVYFDLDGIIENDEPYVFRFNKLKTLIGYGMGDGRIKVTESKLVHSMAEAKAHFHELTQRGEEGTILKDPDGLWQDSMNAGTRPTSMYKFKEEHDGEFIIKGWYYGKTNSKYEHCIAGFEIESECGTIKCNVGSGLNDELRLKEVADKLLKDPNELTTYKEIADKTYLDTIVTVRYNARETSESNDTESLFLPRIIDIRFDKDKANTRDELIAQEQASRNLKL